MIGLPLRGRCAHLLTLLLFVGAIACNDQAPTSPLSPLEPGEVGFSVVALLHGTQSNAADQTRDVAVDAQGNVYVTGGTEDRGFYTTGNAYQKVFGRGQASTSTGEFGNWDVFVMKFSPGGQLLWSTLLGGGNYDRAYALEVDGSGVYVAGRAGEGFPTTAGVLQPTFGGGDISSPYGRQDGFVAKLSLDGSSLIWSTYVGGDANDFLRDVAVDANGDLYTAAAAITGTFPHITTGAFQTTRRGSASGAACRITASATSVRWCTYIGGNGEDGMGPSIRLDGSHNVYYLQSVSSTDAPTSPGAYQPVGRGGGDLHLAKFSANGTFLFGTYFGGSGGDGGETHNLWVTSGGSAYIAASTRSTDLPTTAGAFQQQRAGPSDAFVARISPDGRELLASTYLGGPGAEELEGIDVDGEGNVVVTGPTGSAAFPGATEGSQPIFAGARDAFIAVLKADLTSVVRATLLGGSGEDAGRAVAVDIVRNVIYTGGFTDSPNFPTLGTGILTQFSGSDAFVAGWRYR
jgi:hypothetical protein